MYDYLTIIDGNSLDGIILGVYTGNQNPGTITSSSGCLTFYFTTDGSVTAAGWSANVSCTQTAGTLPTPTTSDCLGAFGLCNDGQQNNAGSGDGNYEDLSNANKGCLAGFEHNSIWFYVKISDADGNPNTSGSGTFGFNLTYPQQYEYDYAVWGPLSGNDPSDFCTPYLPPSRCSYETATGNSSVSVGLDAVNGVGQVYETGSPSDDGWVYQYPTVNDGDVFMVLIDEYYGNPHSYNLTFTGSSNLDCSVALPILMYEFDVYHVLNRYNVLNWTTSSEINSDYFQIERSKNGTNWQIIGAQKAAGNSTSLNSYSFNDDGYFSPVSYYRIKSVDVSGEFKYSSIKTVSSNLKYSGIFSDIIPNPSTDLFSFFYAGNDFETPINVTIVDNFGKVVNDINFNNFNKQTGLIVNIDGLSIGYYSVKIQQNDYIETKKLIVNK